MGSPGSLSGRPRLAWVRPAGSQRATINADSPEELPRLIALAEPGTNPVNDTSNAGNLPERDVQEEP